MNTAAPSRRDRLRHMLADLRMPGALEALDAILHGVDGGTLTAPDAIEQLLTAQIQVRNNRRLQAAMRSSRLPAVKQLRDFDVTFQPSLRREQIDSLSELGFVGAVLLLGAFAFQYIGGLAPCPLCIDQRWPHAIAIGLGLLLLAWPRRAFAALAGLAVLVGAGIAAYHVGVEWKWWPGPQTCTPGSSTLGLNLDELKRRIMGTPMVRCDSIPWSLMGLSMAGWNGVVSLLLGVGALSLTWRR